ncbi:MAG: LemA family protein [Patescibacteria group bacterium]|nr:LemA family protein [Patescibacteria group bacterium]
MKKSTWIWIGVIVILALYSWTSYNGLVGSNEGIDNQWAQVEAQYQRRLDLIPNLVESVKGVMKQEQTVFNDIAQARTQYAGAKTVDQKAQAATNMEGALGRLLAIVENYPQLKSADTVQTLMSQLEGTENRVSVERKRFNDMVQVYNLKTKQFPSSISAKLFGFASHSYFESVQGAEVAPEVKF